MMILWILQKIMKFSHLFALKQLYIEFSMHLLIFKIKTNNLKTVVLLTNLQATLAKLAIDVAPTETAV